MKAFFFLLIMQSFALTWAAQPEKMGSPSETCDSKLDTMVEDYKVFNASALASRLEPGKRLHYLLGFVLINVDRLAPRDVLHLAHTKKWTNRPNPQSDEIIWTFLSYRDVPEDQELPKVFLHLFGRLSSTKQDAVLWQRANGFEIPPLVERILDENSHLKSWTESQPWVKRRKPVEQEISTQEPDPSPGERHKRSELSRWLRAKHDADSLNDTPVNDVLTQAEQFNLDSSKHAFLREYLLLITPELFETVDIVRVLSRFSNPKAIEVATEFAKRLAPTQENLRVARDIGRRLHSCEPTHAFLSQGFRPTIEVMEDIVVETDPEDQEALGILLGERLSEYSSLPNYGEFHHLRANFTSLEAREAITLGYVQLAIKTQSMGRTLIAKDLVRLIKGVSWSDNTLFLMAKAFFGGSWAHPSPRYFAAFGSVELDAHTIAFLVDQIDNREFSPVSMDDREFIRTHALESKLRKALLELNYRN